MSVRAFVGLGGNVGDVSGAFASAAARMDELPGTQLLRVSRRYRAPAWGMAAQPDFLNAVAMLETTLPARDLLEALLAIERAQGRDRASETRWARARWTSTCCSTATRSSTNPACACHIRACMNVRSR